MFKYYFYYYEQRFREPHPNIRIDQIRRIIHIMPYFREEESRLYPCGTIAFEIYEYIINRHFRTNYRNCDYNINHFFSGRIRELRWHECERGE